MIIINGIFKAVAIGFLFLAVLCFIVGVRRLLSFLKTEYDETFKDGAAYLVCCFCAFLISILMGVTPLYGYDKAFVLIAMALAALVPKISYAEKRWMESPTHKIMDKLL